MTDEAARWRRSTSCELHCVLLAECSSLELPRLGSVGLEWQLGGFAADPATGSTGSSGSTSQLVQAMAGFGGGAADISTTVPLGADTSQQQFLTTPHA
jgi:hypothetical protein